MTAQFPGVSFSAAPAADESPALRSDIAGFAVRARRGPVGALVRVRGWREATYHFGSFDGRFDSAYALRGYFENGGDVAYVVRVAPPDIETAGATWDTDTAAMALGVKGRVGISPRHRFEATSPGRWASGLRVLVSYQRWGPSETAELEVVVRVPGEPEERIEHIAPERFVETVNARSRHVRVVPLAPPQEPALEELPAALQWQEIELAVAAEPESELRAAYAEAIELLMREPEVAIVVAPDLQTAPASALSGEDIEDLWRLMLERSDALLDRMVVLDAPPTAIDPFRDPLEPIREFRQVLRDERPRGEDAAQDMTTSLHESRKPGKLRAGALYYPYLWVPDPLGTAARPLRCVPPSGHVAGVISRLDRELGAHHTPANARLEGAVALEGEPSDEDRPRLYREAVNLIVCHARHGMAVWGGRTLAFEPEDGGFLAHRRLVHRLVRAMRRVVEPLVFEENGPVLWLALGRALTTVLSSAFQAGALKGQRPEDAFRVKCDAELNPPSEVDLGRCVCEVAIAPAAPLEFIELRVALSREGTLEVLAP